MVPVQMDLDTRVQGLAGRRIRALAAERSGAGNGRKAADPLPHNLAASLTRSAVT